MIEYTWKSKVSFPSIKIFDHKTSLKFHCFLFRDRFFKESLKYLLDDGSSTSINTLSLFANISKKLKVRQYTGFLYIKQTSWKVFVNIPAGIYLLKVNNRNTRTRCEICSKLIIKISERRQNGAFYENS